MNFSSNTYILLLSLFLFGGIQTVSAQQTFSAIANVRAFQVDKVTTDADSLSYNATGKFNGSLNLRFFVKGKWAIRAGVGLENVRYEVNNGELGGDSYEARRNDLKGVLGIERHFSIFDAAYIYPGLFVPITVVGEDRVQQNFDNIENGNMRAGLGAVLGVNVAVLKVMRVGVEFDATYDNFKSTFWDSMNQQSTAPFQGLSYNTHITFGVAF